MTTSPPIQGYVATLTNKGKTKYVCFFGGLTTDWWKAMVYESREAAYDGARARGRSIFDVPGCIAIGTDAEPLLDA